MAERRTAEALARAHAAGVEVARAELVAERPVDALLDVAERHDAAAIVVGTFDESPLKGAILGSTPHKLVHMSTRPVLIVPVAAED